MTTMTEQIRVLREALQEVRRLYPAHSGSTFAGVDRALAATATIQPVAVPEPVAQGWKMVPIKPNGTMLEAAAKADDEGFEAGRSHGASAREIYDAMLAAAPAAPVAQECDELPPICGTGGQQKFPEPGYSNSLADRVFNLPCRWNGYRALESAVMLGHTMACEQAYDLVTAHEQSLASGFREGRNISPESAPATPAQAATDEVRDVAEWISVEDRLPEVGQLVMVFSPPTKHDYPGEVSITFDCIDPDADEPTSWLNHNEHYEYYCCVGKPEGSVGPSAEAPYTHWMPMPDAPRTTSTTTQAATVEAKP